MKTIKKHCQYCTSFNEENCCSMVGCWCTGKHDIPRFIKPDDTTAETCDDYKRRFWAIGVEK